MTSKTYERQTTFNETSFNMKFSYNINGLSSTIMWIFSSNKDGKYFPAYKSPLRNPDQANHHYGFILYEASD